MPRYHLRLLVAFLIVNPASAARAFNVSPVADATVSAANSTNNYGGGGAFGVSAPGLAKGELQAVLRFDLAAAKASFDGTYGVGNWRLATASLQLTEAFPNNPFFNSTAAGDIAVSWMQDDSWTEGSGTPAAPAATGITFAALPTFFAGGDQSLGSFSFSGATSGTDTYSLSLSSGLSADAVAGSLASIRMFAGDAAVSGVFNSRTNATAASRPVLMLEAAAVPEPATGLLATIGIAVVFGVRRLESR